MFEDKISELRALGAKSTVVRRFRILKKLESKVLGCSAEVNRGWPLAKSIRNIMTILLAVLKHCKTNKNEFAEHFK